MIQELHAAGKLNAVQSLWMAPRKPDGGVLRHANRSVRVKNLAGSPAHRKLVAEFGKRLDTWVKDTNDQGAIPEPREVIEREDPRSIRKK